MFYLLTVSVGGSTRTPNLKRQGSKTGLTKRGVTFKAGLIADKSYEAYYGPLVSFEDVSVFV